MDLNVFLKTFLSAEASCMAYNGETRRLFVGLDNGTISVSLHKNPKNSDTQKIAVIIRI